MHIISREIPYKLFLFRAGMTLHLAEKRIFNTKVIQPIYSKSRWYNVYLFIFEGLDNMKISEKRFCTTFQCRRHDSIIKVYSGFIARENENYM